MVNPDVGVGIAGLREVIVSPLAAAAAKGTPDCVPVRPLALANCVAGVPVWAAATQPVTSKPVATDPTMSITPVRRRRERGMVSA